MILNSALLRTLFKDFWSPKQSARVFRDQIWRIQKIALNSVFNKAEKARSVQNTFICNWWFMFGLKNSIAVEWAAHFVTIRSPLHSFKNVHFHVNCKICRSSCITQQADKAYSEKFPRTNIRYSYQVRANKLFSVPVDRSIFPITRWCPPMDVSLVK